MNTTVQTTKVLLSESKVAEIRRRLHVDVLPAIEKVQGELAEIEEITADWRSTSGNVAAVERVADDRKRLVNRLALLTDVRTRAEAELRVELAQVEIDALQELRNEMQRVGDQRLTTARNIVATAKMLAQMVTEVELQREQMASLAHHAERFHVGRGRDVNENMARSKRHAELMRLLKASDVQAGVEHVIAMDAPAHVWEYAYRRSPGATPDAVLNVEGQGRGALITLDEYARILIADAQVQP